uniref:Uncharacterized protein n=2 Tax=unclassified Inovirus TaxID=356623 RepID=A0AAU8B314_9VIRU
MTDYDFLLTILILGCLSFFGLLYFLLSIKYHLLLQRIKEVEMKIKHSHSE